MPAATIAVVVEPLTGSPCVVDEEHAVGVAVEREPDVGAEVEHRALEVLEVLGLDRIGGVVRERAVELAVEDRQRERQAFEHLRARRARPCRWRCRRRPLSGCSTDDVDERPHVLAERRRAGRRCSTLPGDLAARRHARRDHLLDLREAGLLADRRGAGAAQLDAVVLRGVVARGEHRAGRVELARPRSRRRRSSTARCR